MNRRSQDVFSTPNKWKQTCLTDVFTKMKKGLPLSQKKPFYYQSPITIKIEDCEDDEDDTVNATQERTLPFPFSDDESEDKKTTVRVPVEIMKLNKPRKSLKSLKREVDDSTCPVTNVENDSGSGNKTVKCPIKSEPDVPIKKIKVEQDRTNSDPTNLSLDINLKIKTESDLGSTQLRALNLFKDILYSATNSLQSQKLLGDHINLFKVFLSMNEQYQFFVFKLFTHKLKYYPINSFCNKIKLLMEPDEVSKMHEYLVSAGFLDTNFPEESTLDKLNLLQSAEVKKIYKTYNLPRRKPNKTRMVEVLMKNCKTQSTLSSSKSFEEKLNDDINRTIGNTVKLKEDVLNSFRNGFILVTFANSDFVDWQNYSLQMLKTRIIFPQFQVQDFIVFSTKEEFESYAQARKLQIELENADLKRKEKLEKIADETFENLQMSFRNRNVVDRFPDTPYLNQFTDKFVYRAILSSIARNLTVRRPQKVRIWLEFLVEHFPGSQRIGRWLDALSWLHMKYLEPKDYIAASKILVKALGEMRDQLSEVQLYEVANRAEKILKRLPELEREELKALLPVSVKASNFPTYNIDVNALKKDEVGGSRRVYVLRRNGESTYASVEEAALRRYIEARNYTDGRHCEGGIIIALFKLFFWDIIYEEYVPCAFISKVQDVPLDMYTSHFYINRKERIDQRLKEIEFDWSNIQLKSFINRVWAENGHVSCLKETAGTISNDFEAITESIGRIILSKIFQRLVSNLSAYKSGIPDLLIWNKKNKESIFVEVKGEGDTLSVGQTLWIQHLLEWKAKVEVCHVRSIGIRRNVSTEDL